MIQLFNVAIYRATDACGEGHILINGQDVYWSGNNAEGTVTFKTPLTSDLQPGKLIAIWKASCLANEVQILSFHIHSGEQDIPKHGSGFTMSFKQQGQPEVLRVVGEAIDISHHKDFADQWTHPDQSQRFTLASTPVKTAKSCLDDEFVQLEALKAQSHDLQRLIREKKHRMQRLLCDDFRKFRSAIENCDSITCIFRSTLHKVSEYAHIISLHFQHHRPLLQMTVSSEKGSLDEEFGMDGNGILMHGGAGTRGSSAHNQEIGSPIPEHSEPPPTHGNHHEDASPLPITSESSHQSLTLAPYHSENNLPPPPTHSPTPPSPHFRYYHFSRYYLQRNVIFALLLVIILGSITFLTIRHFKILCACPRRQASRSASREERRNRRAFRRAELKYAWSNWWNRYRNPSSTGDYEEKRSLILQQEGALEDAMQDELRGLSMAQEIIGEMARAEEGRSRLYHQANMPQHQHSREVAGGNEVMPISPASLSIAPTFTTVNPCFSVGYHRSSSASSYSDHSIPPPGYEQELDGDIDVVDGFMYSPTFGRQHIHTHPFEDGCGDGVGYVDDATPDSSVVDCSPRMSFDTGRTNLSKERD